MQNNFARFSCVLLGSIPLLASCGWDQDDMRKYAIKRPKDDDDAPARPATTAIASQANANAAAATDATASVSSAPTSAVGVSGLSPPVATATPPGATPAGPSSPTAGPSSPPAGAALSDTRPAAPGLSERERRALTIDNLRRIMAALEAYRSQHNIYPAPAIHSTAGQPLLSWRVELLPYLGYQALYDAFKRNEPWDSVHNQSLSSQIPAVYQSPERFDATTNYVLPVANSTAFFGKQGQSPRRWEDGLENIVLLLEVDDAGAVPWTAPRDLNYNTQSPQTLLGNLRSDGFFAGWGGGQVACVPRDIPVSQLRAMFTVDGGEEFFASAVCQAAMPDVASAGASGAATQVQAPSAAGSPSASGPAAAWPQAASPTLLTGAGSGSRATDKTDSLSSQASAAAHAGLMTDAVHLALAAFLIGEPTVTVNYQWVPGLRRPATAIRFGVGVNYVGSKAEAVRRQLGELSSQTPLRAAGLSATVGDLAEPLLARVEQRPPFLPPVCQPPSTGARNVPPGTPLQLLGSGNLTTMVRAAQLNQIDVLLMFDVDEKQTRSGYDSRSASFAVIDAWSGRQLMKSATVNYLKRERAKSDPLYQDPVSAIAKEFDELLTHELQPEPVPAALRPEHAARRAASLAGSNPSNPLAALGEIKFYREVELISVEQTLNAFQVLVGSGPGTELLAGSPTERRAALESWIPQPDLNTKLTPAARRGNAADDDD